jgi:hypothetical protein
MANYVYTRSSYLDTVLREESVNVSKLLQRESPTVEVVHPRARLHSLDQLANCFRQRLAVQHKTMLLDLSNAHCVETSNRMSVRRACDQLTARGGTLLSMNYSVFLLRGTGGNLVRGVTPLLLCIHV